MSRRLALVIGNSVYQDKTLARLRTPDADVGDLAEILMDPEVGDFDDVKLLVNVTSTTVRRAISEFFSARTRDDLLLLYFSGHGVLDERGRLYLAVKDTDHQYLRANAIPASFVADEMDNSRSQRQVLILDCCHSGAFARGAKGAPGASVGTSVAFEGTGYGRVVLTATDATQYAWEGDRIIGEAANSLFTHYLIQGLHTGRADKDADGQITVDELYDYVYEQVVRQTPKQTPGKWSYKEQGNIVIARSARAATPTEASPRMPEELAVEEEIAHRLEKLYIDGLSAFWLKDWPRAARSFRAIVEVQPDYRDAAVKLEEAHRQEHWAELYAKGRAALESASWDEALSALQELVSQAGPYQDAEDLLERARVQKQLTGLYIQAVHLHQAEKFQAVLNVFAQIAASDPQYPDPDGLHESAQQQVAELERQAQLDSLYKQSLLELDAGQWQSARQLLARVQERQPGYRETEPLLARLEEEIRRQQADLEAKERLASLYAQAQALARARRWPQAMARMDKIHALQPDYPDPHGIATNARAELARRDRAAQRPRGGSLIPRPRFPAVPRPRLVGALLGVSGLAVILFAYHWFSLQAYLADQTCSVVDDGQTRVIFISTRSQRPVWIDGKISYAGEWSDATCGTLHMLRELDGPQTSSARWWVKSDGCYLYVLVQALLSEQPTGAFVDFFWPFYMNGWEHSDGMFVNLEGEFSDTAAWDETNWYLDKELSPPGMNDVRAASSQDSRYAWFEMRKALDSGDVHDLNWGARRSFGGGRESLLFGVTSRAQDTFYARNVILRLTQP